MSSFFEAAKGLLGKLGKRRESGPENRIFDPAVRAEMKAAHSGALQQKKQGYSGYGAPAEAEDASYQQGGPIPSRFVRRAKKGQTSIPSPR